MKCRKILSLATMSLGMIYCSFRAPGFSPDAAWRKEQDAVKKKKKPKERPKSREEAIALFKTSVPAFDAALKEFTAAAPNDPRRWEAILFDAQTAQVRGFAGLPEAKDNEMKFDDILNSSDASAAIKAEAS